MPTLLSSASADLDAVVEFDPVIIGKMSQSGPRYTSYPTADRFHADFGYGNFLEALAALRMRGGRRPLSLYVHVPFCDTLCYYCACNKIKRLVDFGAVGAMNWAAMVIGVEF